MKSWSGTNEMRVRKNQVPHVHTYFIHPPLDPYVLYGTYIVGVYGLCSFQGASYKGYAYVRRYVGTIPPLQFLTRD